MKVEKMYSGKVPVACYTHTNASKGQPAPTVLFLHGQGQMLNTYGSKSVEAAIDDWYAKLVNLSDFANLRTMADQYGFNIVAPLLIQPMNEWQPAWTKEYLRPIISRYLTGLPQTVDQNQVYITGLSLGGNGVWRVLDSEMINIFAAAIAICSPMHVDMNFKAVADNAIPIWAFHAKDDTTISWTQTDLMIKKLTEQNPPIMPKVTYFNTGGHGIWGKVYGDKSVIEWMLEWKSKPTIQPDPVPDPVTDPKPVPKEVAKEYKVTVYKDYSIEIKDI